MSRVHGSPARFALIVALGLAGLVACTPSSSTAHVSITVRPRTALLDAPVTGSVRGLSAGEHITVAATATDVKGVRWTSSARFRASRSGTVSLADPSVGGSYIGRQPMGLFQFMTPVGNGLPSAEFRTPRLGYDVALTVQAGGHIVARASVHRQSAAALGITDRPLRPATGGVYGELYLPRTTTARRPGVLIFGGSEGGISVTFDAQVLAAHGYPTLALAYFDEPGLAPTLADVPLEYFAQALRVLGAAPGVDPEHVVVDGASRGGEAALLVGARFPTLVNAVVAGVPSSVVNPGYPDPTKPAWTLGGRPVPSAGANDLGQADPTDDPQAIIPVERIRGPVLLTCGRDDTEWPSCPYLDAITARLTAHHFRYPVTALRFPGAGHTGAGGLSAYYSITNDAVLHGGTLAGSQDANASGHAKLLAFLAGL